MSIRDLIISEAQAQGVDPNLALGVAHTESRLNQNAISPAGAIGVMQLMPGTAKDLGVNPRDLNQNIKGGVTYLRKMLDTFGGDVSKAVAAYNAGPGNVMKYGGIPPFKETQKYVPAVLSAANMTPPILPLEQTPSPQAQPGFSLDPQSLLPPAPPTMGKGMQTLLGVLGTIGMASGLAANVVSGLRGGPAVGNAGIQSGTGLLEQLANQQKAAQEYEQMQALASNQSIPENVRSALMLGGKQQVASALLPETKQVDPTQQALNQQKLAIGQQTMALNQKKLEGESGETTEVKTLNSLIDRVTELKSKPELSQKEQNELSIKEGLLNRKSQEGVNDRWAANKKLDVVKPKGLAEQYRASYSALERLQTFENLLNSLPEGRIEGNLADYLQKARGDAAVQEYNTLKTLLSADVARKVLMEVGNLNEQEQQRSLKTVDVIGKTKSERLASLKTLRNAMEKAVRGSFGSIKTITDTVGDNTFIDTLLQNGTLPGTPDALLLNQTPQNTVNSLRQRYNY